MLLSRRIGFFARKVANYFIFRHLNRVYWTKTHNVYELSEPLSTTSMVCNSSFFDMPFFQYWARIVHDNFCDLMRSTNQLSPKALSEPVIYHRKLWEFVYILQALYERGLLNPGKKGVGFGVGTEAIPAIIAARGCGVLATDLEMSEAQKTGWVDNAQNACNNLSLLNKHNICPELEFLNLVRFRNVNMNKIPDDIAGYDFCWSACALEHLGSIQHGVDFIKNSLKCLKRGGIAIHTTEFNLSSDLETLDNCNSVIFRKQDLLKFQKEIEAMGHYVYPIDFNTGVTVVDKYIDLPPYSQRDMHLRLNLMGFHSTSIGLIIQKG